MIDNTDREILKHLKENSRLQWKEVGEKVHLSGPAVASRIRKLEEAGIIEGFTVKLNLEKLGANNTCFITVYMKNNDHSAFQRFINSKDEILEAHRTSGGGCYLLKVAVESQEKLNKLLDEILFYGNYGCSMSIGRIK